MDTIANNVIMFPSKNINFRGPQSIEEIDERVDMVKQIHIQSTIETVAPILFDNLSIAGFPPSDDDSDLKHGALIVESIRSFLCSQIGFEHPLQVIAENLFEYSEEEDGLIVSEKIKIVITPNVEGQGKPS